jgi:hypothetical protein
VKADPGRSDRGFDCALSQHGQLVLTIPSILSRSYPSGKSCRCGVSRPGAKYKLEPGKFRSVATSGSGARRRTLIRAREYHSEISDFKIFNVLQAFLQLFSGAEKRASEALSQ